MKKLSLIIALVACVTLGGVYATWSYATNPATASDPATVSHAITSAEVISKGSITATGCAITIDDANHDHVAELVCDKAVKADFAPQTTITHDPCEVTAIRLLFTININTTVLYNEKSVFSGITTPTEDTGATVLLSTTNKIEIATDAAVSTFSINLEKYIQLGDGTLALHTKAEYDAFAALLATNTALINVVVSEYVPAA